MPEQSTILIGAKRGFLLVKMAVFTFSALIFCSSPVFHFYLLFKQTVLAGSDFKCL